MQQVYYLAVLLDIDMSVPFAVPTRLSLDLDDITIMSQHVELEHAVLRCLYDTCDHGIKTGEFLPMAVLVKEGENIRNMNDDEIDKSEMILTNAKSSMEATL